MTQRTHYLDYRILTFEPTLQRDFTRYIRQTFAQDDDVLLEVRQNTIDRGLPQISIRPEEGQLLGFLALLTGARRILEVGALAGYSGIWLARALPDDGQLITLELDPRHAQIAREHFALAGVSERVTLIEGEAHHILTQMEEDEPFDMVFLDADKEGLPDYLAWSVAHTRSGGLITAHNAFQEGRLLNTPPDRSARATLDMLHTMATHPRLTGTIIPVGDGIAAAIVW
jgi:predicted O-methyltransferase YrrM